MSKCVESTIEVQEYSCTCVVVEGRVELEDTTGLILRCRQGGNDASSKRKVIQKLIA